MKNLKYLFFCLALVALSAGSAQAAIGWAGQIWPNSGLTYLPNQNIGVYVQVWKGGCTDPAGPCADIAGTLFYKRASEGAYSSVPLAFNTQIGANDEWWGEIPALALNGGEQEYFYVELTDLSDGSIYVGAQDQAGNNPPFVLNIQPGLSRDVAVTFRVDMNCVNPALFAGGMFFTGDFFGWGMCNPGGAMTDADNDGIWEGTLTFPGGYNAFIQYKFQRNDGTTCNWECGGNHTATIDDSQPTQTLDVIQYCCESWGPQEISTAGSYCVSLCCCSNELWVRLNTTYNPPIISGFSYVPGCVDCGGECTPGSGDVTYEVRQGGDGNWYMVLCLAPEAGLQIPPGEDVYAGCFCITIDGILPVEMAAFDAVGMVNAVRVDWTTATEQATSHFIIERSTDQANWTGIAQVAARGESSSETRYSYTDTAVETGVTYSYRLTVVDVNGSRTTHAQIASASPIGEGVVTEFALAQNFPNPFNPETNISYTLAEVSKVTLKVFTVTGAEVATLVNGTQEAGSFNVTFNAASLPSGVYFYRLEAGSFTATHKMLLLK
ncbi:MAG: T9SS type A sorting domain-containing protein [bacterium]|nr:T9SS type A sorting domain-containing protein [bacterium]